MSFIVEKTFKVTAYCRFCREYMRDYARDHYEKNKDKSFILDGDTGHAADRTAQRANRCARRGPLTKFRGTNPYMPAHADSQTNHDFYYYIYY